MRAGLCAVLVASMLSASCSLIIVHDRNRDQRRPSGQDYAAPIFDSVLAVAAVVAAGFLARSEAGDPECMGPGFLGGQPTCGDRYSGAEAMFGAAVIAAGSSMYGWWKIYSMRNPSPPPGFFCTTSPELTALCFCSRVEAECEERQRAIGSMGATMTNCMASPMDTCGAPAAGP